MCRVPLVVFPWFHSHLSFSVTTCSLIFGYYTSAYAYKHTPTPEARSRIESCERQRASFYLVKPTVFLPIRRMEILDYIQPPGTNVRKEGLKARDYVFYSVASIVNDNIERSFSLSKFD